MNKYIFQKDEATFGYKFLNVNSPITVPTDEVLHFNYTIGSLEDKTWKDMLLFGVRDHSTKALKVESMISRTELTDRLFTLSFRVELLDSTATDLGYIEIIDPRGELSHVISFTKAS